MIPHPDKKSTASEILEFMKGTGKEIVAKRRTWGVYFWAELGGSDLSLFTFAEMSDNGLVVRTAFDQDDDSLEYWRVCESVSTTHATEGYLGFLGRLLRLAFHLSGQIQAVIQRI